MTRCRNCTRPIYFDVSRRLWLHASDTASTCDRYGADGRRAEPPTVEGS